MASPDASPQPTVQPKAGRAPADSTLNIVFVTLRGFVRTREVGLTLVSLLIGALSGALVLGVSLGVQAMHVVLFGIDAEARLSAAQNLPAWRVLLIPILGGAVLSGFARLSARMGGRLADAIEANALYGGRLSMTGSVMVTAQTMASCGFGASVGLEAGYAQICAAVASRLGLLLSARRADLRLLVACGAAGAISAAFAAPLAGAFYGFEVVLGTYTVAAFAPVAVSALTANLVARGVYASEFLVAPNSLDAVTPHEIVHVIAIAVLCALVGIVLMLAVSGCDALFRLSRVPNWLRPLIGGVLVGALGLITPEVLGAGHGALQRDLVASLTPTAILVILVFKGTASAVSLGAGFRGGLFYASLLLGSLLGRLYHDAGWLMFPGLRLDPDLAALTGMAAFGTGVIGAPVTMTALALETTGNFSVTVAALIASAIASVLVRDLFGYSFATWRFHLRGEAIRGPQDVGWLHDLSVRKLMRTDVKTIGFDATVADARKTFPLGADKQVAALDGEGRYVGLALLDDLYTAPEDGAGPLGSLLRHGDHALVPWMQVREALQAFQKWEADALVVIDGRATRRVIGLLTEAHALRRYREELERQTPDILQAMPSRPDPA